MAIKRRGIECGLAILVLGLTAVKPVFADQLFSQARPATAVAAMFDDGQVPDSHPDYFDTVVTQSPPTVGQQPFKIVAPGDQTPSQTNNNQLNQLFTFENTPDNCAAGEGYLNAQFEFVKFPGSIKEYRYQLQGQYGITDQIAVGAFVPIVSSKIDGTHVGLGDLGIYGQYKFDRFINPEVIDLTAQVDMILPTGNEKRLHDTGRFGVRPLLLAYKDFGHFGPGDFGAYGELGFTITTHSDFRFALAATYQVQDFVGIVEFYDQAGDRMGRPLVFFSPGLVYRGLGPLEIGVGVPIGINNGNPDWALNLKVTYVFAK